MSGKKPNRRQKEAIEAAGWNPDNWLVLKVFSDRLEIKHRVSGKTKQVHMLS